MNSEERVTQTVAELLRENGGSIKTGPFGTALKASEYAEVGVPLISVREIGHGCFHVDSKTPKINSETAKRMPEYLLEEGDIVFARKGGIERCALVKRTQHGWFLGSDGIRLRPPKNCDARFLAYSLQTRHVKDWLLQNSTGSTMASLNSATIGRIPISLPIFDEQSSIANVLELLDDRITLLRETNKTLESITQAIFKSWFVDFDPVRAKMGGRQPEGMDEETAALFPHHFEELPLGSAPRGWQIKSLDKIADYLNGLALQKFPPTGSNDLPIIKIAQLRKGETDKNALAAGSIKPEYVVQDGDILFSWSGSLEVEIWCGGYGALNQHLFKVTSAEHPKWFYYLWTRHHLPSFRHIAESKATTMGHIQRKHLSEATAAVPCSGVLEKANEIFEPLINLQIGNAQRARTLTALRDALLPRLISGQLRLPDAQEQVENALS